MNPIKSLAIYGGFGIDWFFTKSMALEISGSFLNHTIKDWRWPEPLNTGPESNWPNLGNNGGIELEQYTYSRRQVTIDIGFKFFIAK